ncbi:hypothetical protein D0C36_20605 [Mucilaginibacter conchicola]|uniref:Uncharacterized protein n=1 Tax=Mucilaginibacter conchicola TaxID=2303333 RepID=A0A372NQU9_9SPHI|nr:hypothetical protein D0C36_20605 [Mucilaginibacter conchicola]
MYRREVLLNVQILINERSWLQSSEVGYAKIFVTKADNRFRMKLLFRIDGVILKAKSQSIARFLTCINPVVASLNKKRGADLYGHPF